jgi:hypothetical protein
MIQHRSTTVTIAIGIIALVLATSAITGRAADERFKVIVHPGNSIAWIERAFLCNAYLKKEIEWSDGSTILPVDLATRYSVRDQFTHEVLRKTSAQLKNYWNQRIFSGKGTPPPEARVIADVIAYVLANHGAVGYIPAEVDPGGAKVIEVR